MCVTSASCNTSRVSGRANYSLIWKHSIQPRENFNRGKESGRQLGAMRYYCVWTRRSILPDLKLLSNLSRSHQCSYAPMTIQVSRTMPSISLDFHSSPALQFLPGSGTELGKSPKFHLSFSLHHFNCLGAQCGAGGEIFPTPQYPIMIVGLQSRR